MTVLPSGRSPLTPDRHPATIPGWPEPTAQPSPPSPPNTACPSTTTSPDDSSSSAPAPASPDASPPATTATSNTPPASSATSSAQPPSPTASRPRLLPPPNCPPGEDGRRHIVPLSPWPTTQPWRVVRGQHVLLHPDARCPIDPATACDEELDRVWAGLSAWEWQHSSTLIGDIARRLRVELVEAEDQKRRAARLADARSMDQAA